MRNRLLKFALLSVALVVATSGAANTRNDFDLGRNMEIIVNMMHALSTHYVDKIDADEMASNAAAGMTLRLDPYTTFLSEKEWAEFESHTSGQYGGIGSLIRNRGDYVVIAEPYIGSPADEAGLKIGDKIVAINGEDMCKKGVGEISKRLRGEPNTKVSITVERLLTGKREEITIRRRRIVLPSVTYADYVAEGVGYIRHANFTENCYNEMRAAIKHLQSKGELKSLILDYRNNGGGILPSAANVLSLFVPKGTKVVEIRGRDGKSKALYTEHEPLLPNTPLAVLINENSASASEIVSGAIQDLDRGVVVGQRSFGKGLVQTTIPIGFKSYVKVTTHKYYIPSGRCVQAMEFFSDGRAKPVADSLIQEFKTAGGRKVYDGGGIMPDRRVEPEYVSLFVRVLSLVGLVDDFGDEYMKRNHTKEIDVRNFTITDADYKEFAKMVMERDIPYKSESRIALEALRNTLAQERNTSLDETLAVIEKGLKDDKQSLLEICRKEITTLINENIVLRYAYAQGVIANSLKDDKDVAVAKEILANKATYEHIVTKQDTARK